MPSRFVAPKRLETLADVQKAFAKLQESLDAPSAEPRTQLITSNTTLRAGEFVRISPRQGQVLYAKLPKANADNFGSRIEICLERPNGTLRIAAQKPDVVAGGSVATFTVAGLVILESNGVDQWVLMTQLPTSSPVAPVLDGEYIVGSADPDLPNAAVATDSTEVDFSYTPGGVATWVLNAASVAFSKLANLTGLSVLGRAANSTGVMAAITAANAREVLQVNDAGTALAWQYPVQLVSEAGAQVGKFHSIRFHGGTHTTASSAIPGGAFGNDTAVVLYSVNVNTLAAAFAGAGMTATTGVMNVIGSQYINVSANDVAWTGFDVDNNSTGSPSTGWKGIDFIDGSGYTWNLSAPGGGRIGAALTLSGSPPAANPNVLTLSGISGNQGTVDVTSVGVGGSIFVSGPVADWQIEGFSVSGGNPQGYWFYLACGNSAFRGTLFNEDTTPTGNNRIRCANAIDYTSEEMQAVIYYTGTRWMCTTGAHLTQLQNAANNITVGATGNSSISVSNSISYTAAQHLFTSTNTTFDVNVNGCEIGGTSPYLVFNETATSTLSMSAGQGMIWVDDEAPTRLMFTNDENVDLPLNVHCVATKTTTTTVTSSTFASVISYTRPANADKVGTTYRIKAKFVYTKTAVNTTSPSFRVLAGANVLATLTLTQNTTAATAQMIDVEALVTIRTVGALLTAVHSTMMSGLGSSTLFAAGTSQGVQVQAAAGISTTISQSISLECNIAATVASNSMSCNCATIERLE
jgi:hypothetical protein